MKLKRLLAIAVGTAAVCLTVWSINYRIWLAQRTFCDPSYLYHYEYIGQLQWDPPEVVDQKMVELMNCVRRDLMDKGTDRPAKMAIEGLATVVRRFPLKEDEVVSLYFEVIDHRSNGSTDAMIFLPRVCRSRINIESAIGRLKRYLSEKDPRAVEDAEIALHKLEKMITEADPSAPMAAPQPGN